MTYSHEPLRIGDGGVIRGVLGNDVGAEGVLALGRALGRAGKVAVGCFGGAGAQMLLRTMAGGITAAGGTALYHDMECAAQAAWLGEFCQVPVSAFIEQDGERVYLHLFDDWGLPLKEEPHLLVGEGKAVGRCERLPGSLKDYAADGARRAKLRGLALRTVRVAVPGSAPAERGLRLMLETLGCQVTDQGRRGIPAFMASHGGFRLSARDESGALLSPQQLLGMVALAELEHGGGRLAVADDASAAVELIAAGFHKKVLRLGRDGEPARRLYRSLPWLRDAAFGAARLCSRMALTGERLEQLCGKTPRFSGWTREVPIIRDRNELMGELTARAGRDAMTGAGLRLRCRGGWVYLVPLSRRPAIKVMGEGVDLEVAAELCDFYAAQVSKLDGRPTK